MIKPHIQGNYTLHRFIRSSFIIDDIKEMVKALESKTETDEACVTKNQNLTEKLNKRPKYN